MNKNSPVSSNKALSSLPERPEISAKENLRLPRRERLYNHLLWPKYFHITEADSRQLERMKLTFNILMAAPTDFEARAMVRAVVTDTDLSTAEVMELIYETKDLFGKLQFRNIDFDRGVMRMQLLDLVRRNRVSGNAKEERLGLLQLMKLDSLAVKENESNAPIVPALPNVVFVTKYAGEEAAQIESSPDEEE